MDNGKRIYEICEVAEIKQGIVIRHDEVPLKPAPPPNTAKAPAKKDSISESWNESEKETHANNPVVLTSAKTPSKTTTATNKETTPAKKVSSSESSFRAQKEDEKSTTKPAVQTQAKVPAKPVVAKTPAKKTSSLVEGKEETLGHAQQENGLKNFTPFFDRVVVKRLAPAAKTRDGILIPEKAEGKVLEATVVAAGPGARTQDGKVIPTQVKVGDRVLLPEYGGSKVIINEKEYLLCRESDIMGKFN